MKVKTTVKAGLVVGIGNVLGALGTGNNAEGGSSVGSNVQTGNGIQVNLL